MHSTPLNSEPNTRTPPKMRVIRANNSAAVADRVRCPAQFSSVDSAGPRPGPGPLMNYMFVCKRALEPAHSAYIHGVVASLFNNCSLIIEDLLAMMTVRVAQKILHTAAQRD